MSVKRKYGRVNKNIALSLIDRFNRLMGVTKPKTIGGISDSDLRELLSEDVAPDTRTSVFNRIAMDKDMLKKDVL